MPASFRPYRSRDLSQEREPAAPAPHFHLRLLLAGGQIAPVLFVAVFIVEGMLEPGYSALTDYVSDLSLGSDGWMQVASFIVCGWLLVGFAVALRRLAEAQLVPASLAALIAIMGFGLIGAGVFETDPSWGHITLHGELHYVFTAIIGGSLGLSSVAVWLDRRDQPLVAGGWLAMGWLCVGLFSASLVAPTAEFPGLLERIALIIGAAGLAVLAQQQLREIGQGGGYAQNRLATPARTRHEFERKAVAA